MIALLALAAAYAVYWARIRQIERAMNLRFNARLEERSRIARELHDTLLQTIQGSKMVADGLLQEHDDQERSRWALQKLSEWLSRAVDEVRASVDALRTPAMERDDLAGAFRHAAEEFIASGDMRVRVSTVGTPRVLDRTVRNEVYRIGYEAIRNARMHAHATEIVIRIAYGESFELQVTDDGCGMEECVLREGKTGHFGLSGMRERAARIGADLSIRSQTNQGTDVRLVLARTRWSRQRARRDAN